MINNRLLRLQQLARDQRIDAVLVTPGADLRYLTGYNAKPLERLTCLIVQPEAEPALVVPNLELAAAEAAEVPCRIITWDETEDPIALVRTVIAPSAKQIAVDDQMWASRVLALQASFFRAKVVLTGSLINQMRMRKTPEEIDALRSAGKAIDRVHARMGEFLHAGRTERQVGQDIAAAILEEGHITVDFVIVGAGPNGASPHHDVSDRVIQVGEPVVVDIGGTTAEGYCSDSTRNYVIGEAPEAYRRDYDHLLAAQEAQVRAVRPGISAETIDAIGRDRLAEADLAQYFMHRTGHGIGQETHEEPYIVAGNTTALEPGMAFSIEPGIYRAGQWGARIEDIVVVTESGVERLNHTPRMLVQLH